MFLLVPAYPGCPGSKAVKRSLLLLYLYQWIGPLLPALRYVVYFRFYTWLHVCTWWPGKATQYWLSRERHGFTQDWPTRVTRGSTWPSGVWYLRLACCHCCHFHPICPFTSLRLKGGSHYTRTRRFMRSMNSRSWTELANSVKHLLICSFWCFPYFTALGLVRQNKLAVFSFRCKLNITYIGNLIFLLSFLWFLQVLSNDDEQLSEFDVITAGQVLATSS